VTTNQLFNSSNGKMSDVGSFLRTLDQDIAKYPPSATAIKIEDALTALENPKVENSEFFSPFDVAFS
jgi:hypothetical protein